MPVKSSLSSKKNRSRLWVLLFVFYTLLFVLIGRLGYIQLVWAEELQQLAQEQWLRESDVFPVRGAIKDRNGNIIAQSAITESVSASPANIADAALVAKMLAPILEMDESILFERLSDVSKGHVWLKRQVDRVAADKVRELNIPGIGITEEPKRFYPNGSLAAHILGFTMRFAERGYGIIGQEGVELFYDEYLRGLPGSISMETDDAGNEMTSRRNILVPPVDGLDLVLSIDLVIQHFVEREIENVVAKHNPKKVYAIVMDPDTGEILALANYPEFDPNTPPRDFDNFEEMQDFVKNFSVKDNLEPGSIFKILTAAAALEQGAAFTGSTYYCPGFKIVDGQRIRCWRDAGHGRQTFAEVLINSCNPAFMEMALRLGLNGFYESMALFGLGEPTGIDIFGEESGILVNKERAKTVDLARMSFGQAIAVTPLQMINSVAAVINGGYLMKPQLAKAIFESDTDDETSDSTLASVREMNPTRVRRVISEETSKVIRQIMEDTVTYGSGRNAYSAGFRVGGKTGTAQKYGPTGEILEDKNISSFIGFAPSDDPELIVLFMVDEPQAEVTFGSIIAAPHVGRILEDSLKYMNIEPVFEDEEQRETEKVTAPDVVGLTVEEAAGKLNRLGLNFVAEDSGSIVKAQVPSFGSEVFKNSIVLLYLGEEGSVSAVYNDDKISTPDVLGKTIREAGSIMAERGLELVIEGQGIAYEQQPEAGVMVEPKTSIIVSFMLPDS